MRRSFHRLNYTSSVPERRKNRHKCDKSGKMLKLNILTPKGTSLAKSTKLATCKRQK